MNALEVRNLVKKYPAVTAVDGVSFAVAEGSCFGLLGPNGAGKTTTVEIL
ncbi:MAG: ATP-binding cassette domain-containing protein, partial [Nevskiales bacterium]